jgi:biotin carboxyl carrier protein
MGNGLPESKSKPYRSAGSPAALWLLSCLKNRAAILLSGRDYGHPTLPTKLGVFPVCTTLLQNIAFAASPDQSVVTMAAFSSTCNVKTNGFVGTSSGVRRSVVRPVQSRKMVPVQMAVKEVFMPALSSTMTEGKIVSWLKNVGDKITKGESVVVVESDKADMDVESFNEGILGAIVVPEGGVAPVGQPIAYIAETEADLDAAKAKAGGAAPAAPAAAAAPVVCYDLFIWIGYNVASCSAQPVEKTVVMLFLWYEKAIRM